MKIIRQINISKKEVVLAVAASALLAAFIADKILDR